MVIVGVDKSDLCSAFVLGVCGGANIYCSVNFFNWQFGELNEVGIGEKELSQFSYLFLYSTFFVTFNAWCDLTIWGAHKISEL